MKLYCICEPLRNVKKDDVYRIFGDIALVMYATDFKKGNVKLSQDMLKALKVNVSDLWPSAIANSGEAHIVVENGVRALRKIKKLTSKYGYVTVTTSPEDNGAISVFMPGVLERLSDLFHSDSLEVYFVSKHKAIVHPPGCEVFNRVCKESNKDFLTNSRFIYDVNGLHPIVNN